MFRELQSASKMHGLRLKQALCSPIGPDLKWVICVVTKNSWINTYCYVLQLGIVGGRLLPHLWIYNSAKIICTKDACMQVPDVMHVPWRTKYGHKDSCHHNKFYKTWIISGSVIWHTYNNYEYDHVPAIIVLASCKADVIHVTHLLVALVTKLMTS